MALVRVLIDGSSVLHHQYSPNCFRVDRATRATCHLPPVNLPSNGPEP
jgi:hypothetical protein